MISQTQPGMEWEQICVYSRMHASLLSTLNYQYYVNFVQVALHWKCGILCLYPAIRELPPILNLFHRGSPRWVELENHTEISLMPANVKVDPGAVQLIYIRRPYHLAENDSG